MQKRSSAADEVEYYRTNYGELSPEENPLSAQAHKIFGNVRRAADKTRKRLPRLVVTNRTIRPWALALPSGDVILSREAISVCHKKTKDPEACIAFVLGHELAHLAHDDFLHREIHNFVGRRHRHEIEQPIARDDSKSSRKVVQINLDFSREKEIAADDAGFVYASLAGYRVSNLLVRDEETNFFDIWVGQTNDREESSSVRPDERSATLARRLSHIQGKLDFFNFGVRLSHFDSCEDAVYFFREFLKVFAGREVLNNLGFCYLQLARREMQPEQSYFYWLPLQLDGQIQGFEGARATSSFLKNLTQGASRINRGKLNVAVEYLTRAAEIDPEYLPPRINLAVAYLYLGKPHLARSVLVDAKQIAPESTYIHNLEALILYEQSDVEVDLWPTAAAKLEALAERPDAPLSAVYNLARLMESRRRLAQAGHYWNRLTKHFDQLPNPIRTSVCRRQSVVSIEACDVSAPTAPKSSPWRFPLTNNQSERQPRRTALADARVSSFDWYKDKLFGDIYIANDGSSEVLVLDDFLVMQVIKGDRLSTVSELVPLCERPLRRRSLVQGTIWSCVDWAAVAWGEDVREVWAVPRP